MSQNSDAPKTVMQRILDVVERVGNKVPHPAVIFLMLIAIVVILSHVMHRAGVEITTQVIEPAAYEGDEIGDVISRWDYDYPYSQELFDAHDVKEETIAVRSLLTTDGLRFIYESVIPSFMGFTAVGLIIVAMIGVGVAEESGLVNALIRKLVVVSPRAALCYILVLVGILSSIAADAGYLVLIPLAGTAFVSVGRHPLAGLATGFAAVAGAFTVNMLIKPLDAILTEFTNDAIHLVDPEMSIGLTSNLWFSIASVLFLTVLVTLITERIVEPRLGAYQGETKTEEGGKLSAEESRGLRFALAGLLGVLAMFGALAIPDGAPLRNAETGALIGDSPLMNGLIAVIMVLFLVTGAAYGIGARTMTSLTDIIKAMEKALAGLGSLILLLFVISQFVAYFNYSNIGTIMAVKMAAMLTTANIGPLWLLLGFIVVVGIIDLFITGAIAKWAIFAPIFVPVLIKLGVDPEAVLAAYRVGDSPINAITPLNAYFALVVTFCQKYDKTAGVGTVVALMLPYVVWMFLLWMALFAAWQVFGLPWGL